MTCLHLPGVLKLHSPRPVSGRVVAPVLLDSPHSGSQYPDDFNTIAPIQVLQRQEDSFVDQLFEAAPYSGATLLCAEFPRSYIDTNRAADDIDINLIDGDWPTPLHPSDKSRLGHGLIWYSYPDDQLMYDRKLSVEEVTARLNNYWRPYHHMLEEEVEKLYTRFGGVWHINCHSMPNASSPFVSGAIGGKRADMVLGTLDGRSCSQEFCALVKTQLEKYGYNVRVNYPYKGAEIIKRYGYPNRNRHSIQIEINRAIYMNEHSLKITQHFRTLQTHLAELCNSVCYFALSKSLSAAAE